MTSYNIWGAAERQFLSKYLGKSPSEESQICKKKTFYRGKMTLQQHSICTKMEKLVNYSTAKTSHKSQV